MSVEPRWPVPKAWNWISIESISKVTGGGTPTANDPRNFSDDGGIPWITPADLTGYTEIYIARGRRNLSDLGYKNSAAKIVPAGTVLFTSRAPIGYCAIAANPIATNQGFKSLTLFGGISSEFTRYYLKWSKAFLESLASGTTFLELSGSKLEQVPFPLPPLAEQKRIVAKLDALTAKSARARAELNRIETLVSRFKQAVLSNSFSGELTKGLRTPSKQKIEATILYPFSYTQLAPATWRRYLFSEVCKIVGGSQPPKDNFAYSPREGYMRLVQIRDYKSDAKATYIPIELARRFCSVEDIMIGRYGPPIFQILRGIEGAYNVALMKAEPTEAVDRGFLYWYLHHPVLFKYVEIDSKRTAGQDGVNKGHLERWPILLPPLLEQREIVRRIESAFAKIDRLADEARRALQRLGALDEAILAKAFRGELVAQDDNDEPASVLLERIRAERADKPKGKRGRNAQIVSGTSF